MKILAKFAFAALVLGFVTLGGANAPAQTCDAACQACKTSCGNAEGRCIQGCGSSGGPICRSECVNAYTGCFASCSSL
jgi:hypothetical protein